MSYIENLYKNNKLIVRAMDMPNLKRGEDNICYDCSIWINEFEQMQSNNFSSVSSTLIIPDVPVHTYKNIGYLVDSDIADCFHFCKTDSGSSGNITNGDFHANNSDFKTLQELANYIILNNHSDMNEINMNLSIDGVIGLFVNKCPNEKYLLKSLLAVKAAIKNFCDLDLPIYEYDMTLGKISAIEIDQELIEEANQVKPINNVDSFYYWSESSNEEYFGSILEQKKKL